MTPAADPDWAAEDAAYWAEHRPAYLSTPRRTQRLPDPPFPLGVVFAVQPTGEPARAIAPPASLPARPEPPAPVGPAAADLRTCVDCGAPLESAYTTRCRSCAQRAAHARRRAQTGQTAPAPRVCRDCGAPVTHPGTRCKPCSVAVRVAADQAARAARGEGPSRTVLCPGCQRVRRLFTRGCCAVCYNRIRAGTLPVSLLAPAQPAGRRRPDWGDGER